MAILNFDFKISAWIQPFVRKYFTYNIFAEVQYSNGTILNEKVFEEKGSISTPNISEDTAAILSNLTVETLAENGVNELKANDAGLRVNKYLVVSQNPYIYTLASADGSSVPVAWSEDMVQDPILFETNWMNGPQLDTTLYGDADHQLTITDDLGQILERNAMTNVPDEFTILSVEVFSNNEKIYMTYNNGALQGFGTDANFGTVNGVSVDQLTMTLTRNTELTVHVSIDFDNPDGLEEQAIDCRFVDEGIAEVVSKNGTAITIRGLKEGITQLIVGYASQLAEPITLQVTSPTPKLTITKDHDHSFKGDPTELHFLVEYENGERFQIQSSTLTLTEGDATIIKMDEATYCIIPNIVNDQSFQLQVISTTGDTVDMAVLLPVWDKKLYRFHVAPETAAIATGQAITLEAFYNDMYPDMLHDDAEIQWEIISGEELGSLNQTNGKSVILTSTGQGTMTVKASVYGSESFATIDIKGNTDKILQLSDSNVQIAPGEQKTIYAQVINGDSSSLQWNVTDNGLIRIVSQSNRALTIEGVINGQATVTAICDELQQQVAIVVSEALIQAMDSSEFSKVYYPTEDNPEQWDLLPPAAPYISGNGSSTILYGTAQGSADDAYAIHSGIGDNDDLMVKRPQAEDIAQSFQYAARLKGKKKHQIMIYPEIDFQYTVQYKGDLYYDYNESPFKVNIDAYPAKPFHFSIHEERQLETKRDYEVRMDIGGTIPYATVDYAVDWTAQYPVVDEGDVKDLFTSDKGTFIGAGDRSVWINHGSYISDASNQSYFSGILAKEYMNWESYEGEFTFKTIGTTRDLDSTGTMQDDDIIGLIFKAKDTKNFYLFLWEAEERVKVSWRAGDLNGFNVLTQSWDSHTVASHGYWSDAQWQNYCNYSGWGTAHRRIYKVTNGVLSRVYVPDLGNGKGWDYQTMSSMKVRSIGSKVSLYVRHNLSSGYEKVFEFDTGVSVGGFGACNISQAVEFHDINVTQWKATSGRVPQIGWQSWTGIGSVVINSNVNNFVASSVQAKLGSNYELMSISTEVKDPTTGTCSASIGKPLVVKSFNPPNAGLMTVQSFTIRNTVKITPDNINRSTAVVVFDDITALFAEDAARFRITHPSLQNIKPQYTLVSPDMGDPQYAFDGKQLVFWEGEAPTDNLTIEYDITAYAYQGWIERDLSQFRGGKWATYKVTFQDNSYTVNPKYDHWKWKKAGEESVTNDDSDVLMMMTTEWYKGTFPADIHNEGIVTSEGKVYVDVPPNHEHYVEPNDGSPMPPIFATVDYLLSKEEVGKSKFVWMYWEGTPGRTTRNTKQPVNVINGYPVIKTDRQNDRVVVICDVDPRYIPWTSGAYTGFGKVNGKRPFFGPNAGKANMVNVPTNMVFLPANLINVSDPIIEIDDERVNVQTDRLNQTATFSSDYQDAYIWYTQWYTNWQEDPRSFFADLSSTTLIEDTVSIDPYLNKDYDENVQIDGVELTSNNPFVAVWPLDKKEDSSGLLGTYYKFPQQIHYIKQGFVVDGDYHIKSQTFHIDESQSEVKVDGLPLAATFTAAEPATKGIILSKTSEEVKSIYVASGQSALKIVGSFLVETGDHYPDLAIVAPNGESFGIAYDNGTWSEQPLLLNTFKDGTPIQSASSYQTEGESNNKEVFTFMKPMAGTWKVLVYNQGIQDAEYAVSSNISKSAIRDFTLFRKPDPWSLKVSVNGAAIPDTDTSWTVLDDGTVHTTAPLVPDDVIHIECTSGGSYTQALPMQSEFKLYEAKTITPISVTKNNVVIPPSTTDGYEIINNTFKVHGSFLTPGNIIMKYSVGTLNNVFTLNEVPAEDVTVYLNGSPLDSSKYTIQGLTLTVDKSLLKQKDWIHIQSYQAISTFDVTKENYLGDVKFQRIDDNINFDWGTGSPLETIAAQMQSLDVKVAEYLPDQISFNYSVDLEVTYPSNEQIDLSNFTGVWVKWDENVGTDVGDWHGPPEEGYDKITNLANQSYRSGWFNPEQVDATNYSFSFNVQELNSGDDDMYGTMFRYNPDTYSFYSFEMDAYWSRNGVGGTGVNGMSIFRNICTNPSQYGTARLTYNKVRLVHLDEGWTYGANEINNIKVTVTGRRIQVFVNDTLKFDTVDDSPDALLQGSWGPITCSQPKTYFWDLSFTVYKTATVDDYASFQKSFNLTIDRPVDDRTRVIEIPVDATAIQEEFKDAFDLFLQEHSYLTTGDLINKYQIIDDVSQDKVFFNDSGHNILTMNNDAEVHAQVMTIPSTAPDVPNYGDYTTTIPVYDPQATPVELFPADRPEPFIAPLVPKEDTNFNDGFAVNWRGHLYAPVAGIYEFTSLTDDGFKLWINDELIIDAWKLQMANSTNQGIIELEAGKWYTLSANYFENQGVASAKLEWKVPGGARELIPVKYLAPSLGYTVAAKVREATPLPWNPMIHNGHYYFQEHEHLLFANKISQVQTPVGYQLLISPRPQQGLPIIVRDNEGNNLRKVSFFEKIYDASGNLIGVQPTLENTETFNGNGYPTYYLRYSHIDANTLSVALNGVTLDKDLYLFDSENSSITFMKNIEFDDIMEFRYKLLYSYYVEMNEDLPADTARIVLHDNIETKKMMDMEIIYEGAKDTPFYRAEEISFNPILNHNHRGFLYLTNKVDDHAKSVQIHVSPNRVPANTANKILITGQVLDKYDNPIQNKQVMLYRDGVQVYTGKTNRAGEVYFYDKPTLHGSHVMKYEIMSDGLQNMEQLYFYEPDIANRYYLEMKTDKAVMVAGKQDAAVITITLRDESWSVVRGQLIHISYEDTKGIQVSQNLLTNDFGQVTLPLTGYNQKPGVFAVTSTFLNNGEEISSYLYMKVIGG